MVKSIRDSKFRCTKLVFFVQYTLLGVILHHFKIFPHFQVSNDLVTEIVFCLESYPGAGRIVIPSSPSTFTTKVKLHDHKNRKLLLNVLVSVKQGSEIQVLK